LDSAKILLREDDAEGACSRAYYAMFCAARAALVMTGAPEEATRGERDQAARIIAEAAAFIAVAGGLAGKG
jgi:hypothetical protein